MIAADQPTIFPNDVRVAVSSKTDGSMKFEWGDVDTIIHNAQRFLARNTIAIQHTINLFVSGQSGWDKIRQVESNDYDNSMTEPEARIESDVLMTNEANVALFLPIADCYGAVFYDPVHRVLALAHLGWQSTEKNMAAATISRMEVAYQTRAEDILVYFSPAIKKNSYHVTTPMQADRAEWSKYLTQIEGNRWAVDLLGYNYDALLASGVRPGNIEIANVDTVSSPDYFSHYASSNGLRNDPEGRFAVVAMMQ